MDAEKFVVFLLSDAKMTTVADVTYLFLVIQILGAAADDEKDEDDF